MSVVVVGLQHTQAPLPLLEAATVADGDLHKVLSALGHRRNVQEAVVLSTCLRTEVYAVVDRFHDAVAEIFEVLSDHSERVVRGALGSRQHPLRRRRHLAPVRGDLRPGVGRHGRERGRGPGSPGLRAGPGGGDLRPRPLRAVPPCPPDRQARPDRDGDREGDDVLRLRRRHRGPGGRPPGPARHAGRRGGRRRDGPRRVPRPLGDPGRGRAALGRRREPLARPGGGTGAAGRGRPPGHAGGAARAG